MRRTSYLTFAGRLTFCLLPRRSAPSRRLLVAAHRAVPAAARTTPPIACCGGGLPPAGVSENPKPAMGTSSLQKTCRLVFSLGVALVSLAACAHADEFSKTVRYSVRMFSNGTLFIDTRTGDLHVEGWDAPRLEIEAEKVVRAGSKAKADPLYDVVGIALEGRDKEIHLSTRYPRRRLWRPFRGESKYSVNFRIKMPYDANLSIKCVNGDVRVFGITGREQLQVNYGDVEVNIPDAYQLRELDAHAWLGYVQSDLQGMDHDSAGVRQGLAFWNPQGKQAIRVRVRMGGVWVYSDYSGVDWGY